MKKIVWFGILVITMFALSACGLESTDMTASKQVNTTKTAKTQKLGKTTKAATTKKSKDGFWDPVPPGSDSWYWLPHEE